MKDRCQPNGRQQADRQVIPHLQKEKDGIHRTTAENQERAHLGKARQYERQLFWMEVFKRRKRTA